jgi:imidazolonepropionase-like amidohydrolase
LTVGVSLLVENGRVAGLWTDGSPPDPGAVGDATVIDASGATIVPGLVDSHAHMSLAGGARWLDRLLDPGDELLAVGEENGELMVRAGVRWARDVGAPRRRDSQTGTDRAVSLMLRERWRGRTDRPYIRAAGTWISRKGAMPEGIMIDVEHAADLIAAVNQQLDEGADLVKIYLDGPDPETPPFSVDELRAVVKAAHERGAKVAAHGTLLAGNRVGARAGIDSLEHGNELDADTVRVMKDNNVTLVATTSLWKSRESFATTTDFGGGTPRANQLAWEVESMVEAGMSPERALAAVTWRGGELLGVPEAGRLVVGGPAHFSLVHGDPLTDPAALWRVWLTR